MLRKRFISLVIGIALMVAVTGASSIVVDTLGLPVTPQAFACEGSGTAGGGC